MYYILQLSHCPKNVDIKEGMGQTNLHWLVYISGASFFMTPLGQKRYRDGDTIMIIPYNCTRQFLVPLVADLPFLSLFITYSTNLFFDCCKTGVPGHQKC